VRSGGWQLSVGDDLHGKTLGIVGRGNIGSLVAKVAHAFGMSVIAWGQNLTREEAEEHGARLVAKEALFREADIVTVHLVLSKRESGRFPGVRFRTARVGLGKLFACLKLRYRPLQSINFA
jgi:phosphoglycerate dehydrogenase-like enzyme